MSFDLSVDEMSVALGFIGIGAPASAPPAVLKKKMRKTRAAGKAPQTKPTNIAPMILPARAKRLEPQIAVCTGLVPPSRMREEEEEHRRKGEEMNIDERDKEEGRTVHGAVPRAMPTIPAGERRSDEENPVAADDDVHGGLLVTADDAAGSAAQENAKRMAKKDVQAQLALYNNVRGGAG